MTSLSLCGFPIVALSTAKNKAFFDPVDNL